MSHTRPSLSDCYQTLGLTPDASEAEVKDAFRKLSFKHHPDKAGASQANNDKFAAIRQAYEDIQDYLAEPNQGRWAEKKPGEGGFPGGGGRGFPGGYGFGFGGFPGSAPPPGYGGGRGGGQGGRSFFPTDDPMFNEFNEFMFGAKGRFPGNSRGTRRPASSGAGFPPGGFPGGFPRFGSSSGGMPPRGWGNFPPPGAGPYGARYGQPFSGESSRGQNYDDGPAPSRDDPLGVVQWSLRRAHQRLAPLPGKLTNMRKWWDKVGECGDLTPEQRAMGRQRFDRAEVHLAKMLSQATGQMEAIRRQQQQQQQDPDGEKKKNKKSKGKGKESESSWWDKMGGSSSSKHKESKKKQKQKQGAASKKQINKWTAAAMRLGHDSAAVMNEVMALEVCAMNDDLLEFLAALGAIKSGGGGSHRRQGGKGDDNSSEDSDSSEDDGSSSEESSSESDSSDSDSD